MGIDSWLGGAKRKAERECARAEGVGLAEGEARAAKRPQGPAWSHLCEPSELNSKTGMETNRRIPLGKAFTHFSNVAQNTLPEITSPA